MLPSNFRSIYLRRLTCGRVDEVEGTVAGLDRKYHAIGASMGCSRDGHVKPFDPLMHRNPVVVLHSVACGSKDPTDVDNKATVGPESLLLFPEYPSIRPRRCQSLPRK